MNLNFKINKPLAYTIKILILSACTFYIYHSVSNQKNVDEKFIKLLRETIDWSNIPLIILVLSFVVLNWSLEALKWKISIRPIEAVGFLASLRGVLSGLAVSFITENNVGQYFGRVWQLKSKNRYLVLGASLMGSVCQTYATFLFGSIGLLYILLYKNIIQVQFFVICIFAALIVNLAGLMLIFYLKKIVALLKPFQKVYRYFQIIEYYRIRHILYIVGISFGRYLVFMAQFVAVLVLFNIKLGVFQLFSCVAMVFFAKSLIPNFSFLSDLGIREFTALFFFKYFNVGEVLVITASLTVWIVNILLPMCFGLLLGLQMHIKDE